MIDLHPAAAESPSEPPVPHQPQRTNVGSSTRESTGVAAGVIAGAGMLGALAIKGMMSGSDSHSSWQICCVGRSRSDRCWGCWRHICSI
jgi:hypothetical protein